MKKLFLTLLTMPTVVGFFLPLTAHAGSKIADFSKNDRVLCVDKHSQNYCVTRATPNAKLAKIARDIGSNFEAGINFTDEESEAAAARFGCDCPACIRAIKQIRAFTGVI
jgi:hypothetical protein